MTDDPDTEPPAVAVDWLTRLDPDPIRAVRRYVNLRWDLIRFLEWQHDDPEAVADEALIRARRQIVESAGTPSDPRVFLFEVAKSLVREGWRPPARRPTPPAEPLGRRSDEQEAARFNFHEALRHVRARDRRILIRYYTDDDHTSQCRELGVTLRELRMIVRRIGTEIRARLGEP